MLRELSFPFDGKWILRKRKQIKRHLLENTQINSARIRKKIAVLGGYTTHDLREIMTLFLLDNGIEPAFYESEYNQYYQDAVFGNKELDEFAPDIVVIYTSGRNIQDFPSLNSSKQDIDESIHNIEDRLKQIWESVHNRYNCTIIQNNFELPYYRLLGNSEFYDIHGKIDFINRLNAFIAEEARGSDFLFINDINYLSACFGIQKWADPNYWYMYKYACTPEAVPEVAFNLVNVIKAIFGKNKKSLVLDLDNTLWGGVIGDDGPEGLELGPETAIGELYSEFQSYIKSHKELGVILTIASKNEEQTALSGFEHPNSILKRDDFVSIKANWENKDINIAAIAQELNIGLDSLVFVDDNPAEREIVSKQLPEVAVPEMGEPSEFLNILDRSGYFECIGISEEDIRRREMYTANVRRIQSAGTFSDYGEYLKSLEMKAEIREFIPVYFSRIAQLTNKSNQFNLTTKRYTLEEIKNIASDEGYITLYGKLEDKFGDNGVVSIVIGRIDADRKIDLHIDLWLMSCRVLKRNVELAMMDELIMACKNKSIKTIFGYYYPTIKNSMVKDFYGMLGFELLKTDDDGNSVWKYEIPAKYEVKQQDISINPVQ